MELSNEIKLYIESLASSFKTADLKASAEALSRRYTGESGKGRRLVLNRTDATAYATVRMPATYGAVSSALAYTFEAVDEFDMSISSVIDVGAGTGAVGLALDAISANASEGSSAQGVKKLVCIERERCMSELGRDLLDRFSDIDEISWLNTDILKCADNDSGLSADLVTAAYALNEMSAEARERALKVLWSMSSKMLVIIEPGTPEGFRQLSEARELLVNAGAFIAAPCPAASHGKCPLKDDWCHFSVRVPRTKLHKLLKSAEVPYEDEKFAYITAVRKPGCDKVIKPADDNPSCGRVLRHPDINLGRIGLELCTGSEIVKTVITKKSGAAFKQARKLSAGDRFQLPGQEG